MHPPDQCAPVQARRPRSATHGASVQEIELVPVLDDRRSRADDHIGAWRTHTRDRSPQFGCASRYAAITLADMRPLARTCIPWSWAQARTASDSPRGAVLVARPAAARFRGAPGRPPAGAPRAAFLTAPLVPVDVGTGDSTAAALVAEVRLAAGRPLPLAGPLRKLASLRTAGADRVPDSFAAAPPPLESPPPRDSWVFRVTRCRP